jgi:tRNA(Ile)-lysidine synthase
MKLDVPAGRYVIAVSGGVDSIALLHILSRQPGVQLTVAHYDHGIRPDSFVDRKLVQLTAKEYGLPFVYHQGRLGPRTSEAMAREARYRFLHQVRMASGAQAIITAHHQDDVLETALLNMMRGTGPRGLHALRSTDVVLRPLLHVPKHGLQHYAERSDLTWREDATNSDDRYLRNYIRHRIMPYFKPDHRAKLIDIINRAVEYSRDIDTEVHNYLHVQPSVRALDRHQFILLPHIVAREVMGKWLRLRAGVELNRPMLERLVVAAKTGRAGTKVDIDARHWLAIGRTELALTPRER